jgi:hypothetical protein
MEGLHGVHDGQVLHVWSLTIPPGQRIRSEISLESGAGRAPTTLKWEVVFPAQLLELEDDGLEKGTAAMHSGKSLMCGRR